MPQVKKVPMRMCIACREMKPKKDMLRIVAPSGVDNPIAVVDITGKQNGRGAYLCASQTCLDRAKKSSAIKRALEANVTDELYDSIEKLINLGGGHI